MEVLCWCVCSLTVTSWIDIWSHNSSITLGLLGHMTVQIWSCYLVTWQPWCGHVIWSHDRPSVLVIHSYCRLMVYDRPSVVAIHSYCSPMVYDRPSVVAIHSYCRPMVYDRPSVVALHSYCRVMVYDRPSVVAIHSYCRPMVTFYYKVLMEAFVGAIMILRSWRDPLQSIKYLLHS